MMINKYITVAPPPKKCTNYADFQDLKYEKPDVFQKKIKHYGFTLAEILTVVAILGIIASITISSAVRTATQKATVVKVLRVYSDLQRMFETDKALNNDMSMVQRLSNVKFVQNHNNLQRSQVLFYEYIQPYFQVTENCTGGVLNPKSTESNGEVRYNGETFSKGSCFTKTCYFLNGSAIPNDKTGFSPCTTTGWDFNEQSVFRRFKVKGGYSLGVMGLHQINANYLTDSGLSHGSFQKIGDIPITTLIILDTNANKKPNTLGRDIFVFALTPEGVLPMSNYPCKKNGEGIGCSDYIIKNKNMNYLK